MLVSLTLVLSLSCGPIQSTAVLMDADNMLAAARMAQAEKLAPYEWTAASLYFAKAKEEVGSSDYEVGVRYGKRALELATKARDVALRNGRRPESSPAAGPK